MHDPAFSLVPLHFPTTSLTFRLHLSHRSSFETLNCNFRLAPGFNTRLTHAAIDCPGCRELRASRRIMTAFSLTFAQFLACMRRSARLESVLRGCALQA